MTDVSFVMRSICSYCKCELPSIKACWDEAALRVHQKQHRADPISHGCCEACAAKYRKGEK